MYPIGEICWQGFPVVNTEIWMCHCNLFALTQLVYSRQHCAGKGHGFFAREIFCTKKPNPVTLQALMLQRTANSSPWKCLYPDATDIHSCQLSSTDKARKTFHSYCPSAIWGRYFFNSVLENVYSKVEGRETFGLNKNRSSKLSSRKAPLCHLG